MTHYGPAFAIPAAERRVLCKLLLCAVAVCVLLLGLTTTARRMVGPLHVHRALATEAPSEPSLAAIAGQRARLSSMSSDPAKYSHDEASRHRHDLRDGSVIALDGAADDVDDPAGSAGATVALTLHAAPPAYRWLSPPATADAWPRLQQRMPASADLRLPERPPKG